MMSRYGIVEPVKQERAIRPVVKATDFNVAFGLNTVQRYTLMSKSAISGGTIAIR